jgi:tetratricopeptide (TPR) repeat protein
VAWHAVILAASPQQLSGSAFAAGRSCHDVRHRRDFMTRHTLVVLALAGLLSTAPAAQSLPDVRAMFDAGNYQQAIDAASASQDPRVMFLVAQSQQKLRHPDQAQRIYQQLAGRPASDPWQAIGKSAVALASSNAGGALEDADQAVAKGGSIAEAYFQRGLALSAQQNFGEAAAAFQKATELDPNWAAAHYNAGIAFSKAKRPDQTATHFQVFMKLAPQAPERGEVQSIMRTLGR